MTAILSVAAMALVLGAVWLLLEAGLRAGDRPGDVTLTAVHADPGGAGIHVTVHNPGGQTVLLGASVRRRSLRSWCESGRFVSAPRRTAKARLLAGRQAAIAAVGAGDTEILLVPFSAAVARRAELVVVVGQADRLRVVHRTVYVGSPAPAAEAPPDARRPHEPAKPGSKKRLFPRLPRLALPLGVSVPGPFRRR